VYGAEEVETNGPGVVGMVVVVMGLGVVVVVVLPVVPLA
jgi:hypothetical protein